MISIRRVYDPQLEGEGARFLVDRLWPRGIKKENLEIDEWIKEAAPSSELRNWYHHNPGNWEIFRERYFAELDDHSDAWQPILDAARHGNVTLLYSSKERQLNNAEALRQYLEKRL